MQEKIKQYFILMRFHKPQPLLLLLWPTLWGVWLASYAHPDFKTIIIFVLGVILTRSAGCVANDIMDRNLDKYVERTQYRPLAAKKITLHEALCIFILLMSLAFVLILFLNTLSKWLAFVGVFIMILYPLLKRLIPFPQLGLGVAFSWGIPMAFAAVQNRIPVECIWLFLAAIIWPIIYDTFYAMVDKQDDLKVGIKSTAILFRSWSLPIVGLLQLMFLCLLIKVGYIYHLNFFYYISLLMVIFLFLYQQTLMKIGSPVACFKAFINSQWVGAVIFMGILLGKPA